ncbi:MAG: ECF-type sigma factor [bacterium]|nr:ECF-type sigma factor [bacterium]
MDEINQKESVSNWIDEVREGRSTAAMHIWQHYFDRLVRAARARLKGQDRGMADEEDIVVSVFESFYRAAKEGRFPQLAGRDELWRLLLTMSARKIVDKQRHDHRLRRGAGQTVRSLQEATGDAGLAIQVIGNEPTPEMVAMMTESVERLFSHLGEGPLRELAVAKLEGYSNAELSQRFGCSERTIERRLHLIREKCRQEIMEKDDSR